MLDLSDHNSLCRNIKNLLSDFIKIFRVPIWRMKWKITAVIKYSKKKVVPGTFFNEFLRNILNISLILETC